MLTDLKFRPRVIVVAALMVATGLLHVGLVLKLFPKLRAGYQDFTIFYTAGQMVRSGQPDLLYDLGAQYRVQLQFAPNVSIRRAALPYNHPPFEALVFAPLTRLSYWNAYLLWTSLNLVILAASIGLLRRELPALGTASSLWLILAASAFWPIVFALIQGQDAILLLLICIAAYVALRRGDEITAGAILAAGLFKFHLIIPLLLLFAIRRPRLLLGFLPISGVLAAISVKMMGWRGMLDYFRFVLRLDASGAGGAVSVSNMPNLHGLIARLAGDQPSVVVLAVTIIVSAAIFLLTLYRRRESRTEFAWFAGAAVTTVLISYHLFAYDLSLIFPVALLLLGRVLEKDAAPGWDSALLLLLFFTPLTTLLHVDLSQSCWFAIVLIWLWWLLNWRAFAEPIYLSVGNRG